MRFEIRIDRLRLQGIEGLTGEELSRQIENELQRLVERWGTPSALAIGGTLELARQSVRLPPGIAREAVGAEVARQLAGSWFGPRETARPSAPERDRGPGVKQHE